MLKKEKLRLNLMISLKCQLLLLKLIDFLTATCRLWPEMIEKNQESPECLKKFPSVKSLDIVFSKRCFIKL